MWPAESAFGKLKRTSTEVPIPQHFDTAKLIVFQTDTSGFVIAGCLNPYDVYRTLRLVNFNRWKCFSAEQHYDTYD